MGSIFDEIFDLENESFHIPWHYRRIPRNWNVYSNRSGDNKVNILDRLPEDDSEWQQIFEQMPRKLDVIQIWKIQNPKTYGRYSQMAENYRGWFGRKPDRKKLFHGTPHKNVESIIHNNFDFRYMDTKDTSRYSSGKGIYFTDRPAYADFHCGSDEFKRCFMFYCEVLIENVYYVCNKTEVRSGPPALKDEDDDEVADLRYEGKDPHPSLLYDTTTREDKDEYVKFRRNEFYPTHLIMFDRYD